MLTVETILRFPLSLHHRATMDADVLTQIILGLVATMLAVVAIWTSWRSHWCVRGMRSARSW